MLYGSGLRKGFASTDSVTPSVTANFGIQQDLALPDGGLWTLRFDVLNAFDREYQRREGSGIGVGPPVRGQAWAFRGAQPGILTAGMTGGAEQCRAGPLEPRHPLARSPAWFRGDAKIAIR
jgi:hypothetical protein